ncbi:hypothetical protein [Mycetocola sp. JXN-3]|uniref:hypothetical protein n=1 Tax=Mycetocola sp. JXN-3 TaxID=2116510 RepID=UPI00165D21DF|nr:hypothetical protein [Mycetocola sp. JXN-3]
MLTISDYLYSSKRLDSHGAPDADALREQDALRDAAILDIRFDTTLLTLWILFDCRGTLFMRDGNVAVIVANNVTSLEWQAPPRDSRWWRPVVVSSPNFELQQFSMQLGIGYSNEGKAQFLRFSSSSAEFHVGDIAGGDAAPPDFADDSDEVIRAGLASWDSPFTPIHSSTI